MSIAQYDLTRFDRLGHYVRQEGKIIAVDQQVLDEFTAAISEVINYGKAKISPRPSCGFLRLISSKPGR